MPIVPVQSPQQLAELIELGARMHAESEFAFLPYDPAKVEHTVKTLASQGRLFLARYENERGEAVGFFFGQVSKYFFNDERIASDLSFYVAPEARGNGVVVLRMIREFERWAKGKGAREVCLGISTGVSIHNTGKLLTRAGYTNMGGTFKRRVV